MFSCVCIIPLLVWNFPIFGVPTDVLPLSDIPLSCFCFLTRSNKKPRAAINANPKTETPIPIPASAPVLRPLDFEELAETVLEVSLAFLVGEGVDVAVGVVVGVEVGVELVLVELVVSRDVGGD